jgi:hypothetical protein
MHTYVKVFVLNTMTLMKETALSFRVSKSLKSALLEVAMKEGRSLAQVCEALLQSGLEAYRRGGSVYLQRFVARDTPKRNRKRRDE